MATLKNGEALDKHTSVVTANETAVNETASTEAPPKEIKSEQMTSPVTASAAGKRNHIFLR